VSAEIAVRGEQILDLRDDAMNAPHAVPARAGPGEALHHHRGLRAGHRLRERAVVVEADDLDLEIEEAADGLLAREPAQLEAIAGEVAGLQGQGEFVLLRHQRTSLEKSREAIAARAASSASQEGTSMSGQMPRPSMTSPSGSVKVATVA